MRVAIGLGAIGAATWLSVALSPLDDTFALVTVVIAICLAIWTGFSMRRPVVDGQIALEALVAVIVVALAVSRYPGLIADEAATLQSTASVEVVQTRAPQEATLLERFAGSSAEYLRTVNELLTMNGEATHAEWDALNQRLDFELVSNRYRVLEDAQRQRAQATWEDVGAVKTRLAALMKVWKKRSPNGFTFAPNDYERRRINGLLETAQASARELQDSAKALR